MNCLAHPAAVPRSEILRRLEQDLVFVPLRVAASTSVCQQARAGLFCLWILNCTGQLSQQRGQTQHTVIFGCWGAFMLLGSLCVPAGSFIWKWSGLLGSCMWRTVFAGRSYPDQEWDLCQEWGLEPQLKNHPRLSIQQHGHVLSVQAVGLCSLPLPSCAVSLNCRHLRQVRAPIPGTT